MITRIQYQPKYYNPAIQKPVKPAFAGAEYCVPDDTAELLKTISDGMCARKKRNITCELNQTAKAFILEDNPTLFFLLFDIPEIYSFAATLDGGITSLDTKIGAYTEPAMIERVLKENQNFSKIITDTIDICAQQLKS